MSEYHASHFAQNNRFNIRTAEIITVIRGKYTHSINTVLHIFLII